MKLTDEQVIKILKEILSQQGDEQYDLVHTFKSSYQSDIKYALRLLAETESALQAEREKNEEAIGKEAHIDVCRERNGLHKQNARYKTALVKWRKRNNPMFKKYDELNWRQKEVEDIIIEAFKNDLTSENN